MTTQKQDTPRGKYVKRVMNFLVLILSAIMIAWISVDTFDRVNLLESHGYMTFQFWVCIVFIIDFVVELYFSGDKAHFFRYHIIFLILSIPYLNIINQLGLHLSDDALYFIRFIPMARAALALAIVISYLSSNAITSMFVSYLVILVFVGYFCSLIFYQREAGVNPEIHSYWTAAWWTAMNLTTVGCYINPVTVAGKIVAIILPITGMIIFPLFTVYLTNFVTRNIAHPKDKQ